MAESGRKRSVVWQYFEKVSSTKVACQLCSAQLSYTGGSTGTMTNHIRFKHKTCASSLLAVNNNNDSQSRRSSDTTVGGRQQTLLTAYRTPVMMSRDKWISCTTKAAEWCARDLRPLSIVDGGGFKDFMAAAAPTYKVPSRTTLGKYLDVAYQAKFNELRGLLNKQTGVALTTDMWSSVANEGYLTITAHFVDGSWNLNNFVLTTRAMEDRHTGLNIANEIRTMVALFDIRESQLVGLVSDNAYHNHPLCQSTLVKRTLYFL